MSYKYAAVSAKICQSPLQPERSRVGQSVGTSQALPRNDQVAALDVTKVASGQIGALTTAQLRALGTSQIQAIEAAGVMRAALSTVGTQTIYGNSASSKGFAGLQSLIGTFGDELVVDAGGTTANTGSSVYAINAGVTGVQYVYGNGTTFDLSAFREGDAVDADGRRYPAFIADLTAWIGLQCVNRYAVGRLKDITAAEAGARLNDAKIAELLSRFPVGERPTHLLMSRRSAFQLQISRTTAPNTKQEAFTGILPGVPTESFGIPIIITDSIGDTEALS